MSIEKIFKNLILLNIGMFILIILSTQYQSSLLIELTKSLDPGFFDTKFGVVLVIIILLMYLVAVYCLYNFKPIGRSLFLLTIAGYIICLLLIHYFLNGQKPIL